MLMEERLGDPRAHVYPPRTHIRGTIPGTRRQCENKEAASHALNRPLSEPRYTVSTRTRFTAYLASRDGTSRQPEWTTRSGWAPGHAVAVVTTCLTVQQAKTSPRAAGAYLGQIITWVVRAYIQGTLEEGRNISAEMNEYRKPASTGGSQTEHACILLVHTLL
ncbi:hypothetical protein BD779DRAFT_1472711 [Infundibulicybe gibba]|nr:hypothetical protein BD779DRAFT_1472711 [Infundibulicybe gibba]